MSSPFYKFQAIIKNRNLESSEQAQTRGVKIQQISKNSTSKRVKSNKIDAQKLLNAATGTAQEQEVINFLRSQGIEVC